jgi:hypothetical protein
MQSVILFTTQTSATDSYGRIIRNLLPGNVPYVKCCDEEPTNRPLETPLHPEGHFYLFNYPPILNDELDLSLFKVIINFRDPRDRLCNVYHWLQQHPRSETSDEREKRVTRLKDDGIDKWAFSAHNNALLCNEYYSNIFKVARKNNESNVAVLTYARLCLDFDSLINKLVDLLEIGQDDYRRAAPKLELERVENISQNAAWIGQQWTGSDTQPGRYKRELSDDTIKMLNEYYAATLARMAEFDPDFRDTYAF